MTTRDQLVTALGLRLGDTSNTDWPAADKADYIDRAIQGLYPTWYLQKTATTTAGGGPIQTMPSGAADLYYVGVQTPTSNRVRVMRGWQEGNTDAVIPKVGITGYTLVWSWTAAYPKPSTGSETLQIPIELEEVVLIRAQITALERLLTERVKTRAFLATNVREDVTEQEIAMTLNALHDSYDTRAKNAIPRPERVG